MKNAQLVRAAKDFAKQPYVWPGGYPLVAIMNDAECMCAKCVKANFPQIARATRDKARDGWQVVAVSVNWESEDLTCSHCNAQIESAYRKD